MNKVTTVNLNGNAYQVEESGYEALQTYLDEAARGLDQNPDKDEIIADIESAIGEKFRALLGPHKSVVLTKEVTGVIEAMGPVRDGSAEPGENPKAGHPAAGSAGQGGASRATEDPGSTGGAVNDAGGTARRLYRIPDGAMLAGVCNGLGAYLDLDVMLVRLGFLIFGLVMLIMGLVVSWFIILPVLTYVLLAIALPAAETPEQRAAARGDPATAQEFIRRAQKGYYESVRAFQNPDARKAWKRKCRQEFRRWKHSFRQEMGRGAMPAPGAWVPPTGGSLVATLALPVLGIAEVAVVILGLIGLVVLIANGAVAGFVPPADVPLWVTIVLYVVCWQVILWPIKMLRFACLVRVTGDVRHGAPHAPFWGSLVGLAALVAGVWLLDHYVPAVHEFILRLPEMLRQMGSSLQQWWNGV